MSKPTVQRSVREKPADFEETYFILGVKKIAELMRRYKAGPATVERWIDEVGWERAEKIKRRK